MKKKFLSLVLALVMVLGTFGNVFAAAATDKKEVPKLTSTNQKVQWLIDNKIVIGLADDEGKETGNMDLDSPIRRDAVAKMLVYAIGEQDLAAKLQGLYRPFPDVTVDSIVNGYISVGASKSSPANGLPFIEGYNEDGTFRPQREVSYAELAKMLVVLVKEDLTKDMAYKANRDWATTWMRWAAQEGILDGVSVADEHAKAPRKDAFAMIYNAFYKLRTVKPVPTNETRGIISKKSVNYDLVLNQGDFEKKFKVTNETVFVSAKGDTQLWLESILDRNSYFVGSLVRVLADKDGNVSHIIEMGNPVVGLQNRTTAWVDLGNKTLDQAQSSFAVDAKDDVTLKVDGENKLDNIRFGGEKYQTTSDTVYYVADYDQNILTQMKDKAAVAKLLGDKTERVYLAYEVLPKSGVKEAKVVVFNNAKNQDTNDIVRVEKAVSRPDFMLSFQKPGYNPTTIEQVDLRKIDTVWPYNYNFTNYDVIDLAHRNGELRNGNVLIDYEKDPIYEIKDLQLVEPDKTTKNVEIEKANSIVLKDKYGFTNSFDLSANTKTFFRNQLVKGEKVQIELAENGNKLAIISVVPETDELRGKMVDNSDVAKDPEVVTGKFISFTPGENGQLSHVLVYLKDGDTYSPRKTPFVTKLGVTKFGVDGASRPAAGDVLEMTIKRINNDNIVGEIIDVKNHGATFEDALAQHKETSIKELKDANLLTDAIEKAINDAATFAEVNDIVDKAKNPAVYDFIAAEAKVTAKDDINVDAPTKKAIEDAKTAYDELNAEQKEREDVKAAIASLNEKIEKYNNAADEDLEPIA
ncbi:Uncharacterised protein [Aedoeadaptatus ivorii]|uniref:SLH domain-containing protein n=1 Tax=Aedoeadaptatus ivorii TaxID=54006 RepID=A0A3S5BWK9_9FIRM|nr:S-layer homology domain-containing protein [Peptoniphilus ivorii]VEJ36219.1 Uncharacterised protein [Peptoniphilus ivorii]